jgi:hypothetical protein
MNDNSHRWVTAKAFEIFYEVNNKSLKHKFWETVATEASQVDYYKDLEFVDVEGVYRDANPHGHADSTLEQDHAHYVDSMTGMNFAAFNHFIDIKKGPGEFDDFDGYSYIKGSAHGEEFQTIGQAYDPSFWEKVGGAFAGITTDTKVDAGINQWLNDEYVHAPGGNYYNHCSRSVERYSFYNDKGKYKSLAEEAKARFPLASSVGKQGCGIPYSVFMPVDNMARYWLKEYQEGSWPDIKYLGTVMHAIQDAAVPHHTAGYNGNWHQEYEKKFESNFWKWLSGSTEINFKQKVLSLYNQWNRNDSAPPTSLDRNRDWNRQPAKNWRADMLVTWMAINAYRAYALDYDQFRKGYLDKPEVMLHLLEQATALSLLVISNAREPIPMARINIKEPVTYYTYEDFAKATVKAEYINLVKPLKIEWSIQPPVVANALTSSETQQFDHLVDRTYKIALTGTDSLGREVKAEKNMTVVRVQDPNPEHDRRQPK